MADTIEQVCDICGKTYLAKFLKPYDVVESSVVRVKHLRDKKAALFTYNTCPHCADKVMRYIFEIQKNRPKKCDFCEFERGPKVDPLVECQECVDYNNFQLKKRMRTMQNYEWQAYKRYLGEEG